MSTYTAPVIIFCIIAQCQELSSPQNGSYLITTNGTTSIATFQCNVGTSLNGTDTLICFPDGSWSTTIPYCGKVFIFLVLNSQRFCFIEKKAPNKRFDSKYSIPICSLVRLCSVSVGVKSQTVLVKMKSLNFS